MSASLAPTFEAQQDEDCFEVEEDEIPEQELSDGKDYHFFFIVDRSGSMSGNRMKLAIDALSLFILSLPVNSTFTIVSFGTNHLTLIDPSIGHDTLPYSDATKDYALSTVRQFGANLGGTEILEPLKRC